MKPQSSDGSGQVDNAGKALPLSRVTYSNLYSGITLTYTAGEGRYSDKHLDHRALGAAGHDPPLRYNVPVQLCARRVAAAGVRNRLSARIRAHCLARDQRRQNPGQRGVCATRGA